MGMLWCYQAQAQINNEGLEYRQELNDSSAQTVKLELADQNVLRNNEYFHDQLTGYTLFASLLHAKLSYQPNAHWKLSGGAFLRKDFGGNGFYQIQPILSLKYQQSGVGVIFGNLEGNFNHRLLEPLYNYERYITQQQENGIQVVLNRKRIWSDTWINWEVMQYNRSDYQEQFTVGHSSKLTVIEKKRHALHGILQGIISHKGGQIDVDTTAMQSKLSAALGFEYSYQCKGFIKEMKLQQVVLYSSFLNASADNPYHQGYAWFTNLQIHTKYPVGINLGYWRGDHFQASRGGDLFQSMSSEYVQKSTSNNQRALLLVRVYFQKQLWNDLYVDVRLEPYIDINQHYAEYAYGAYLTYKKDFVLFNEKNHPKK